MTRKSTQMRTEDTILIPELEEAIQQGKTGKFGLIWSEREEAIMIKYYGKVETKLLLTHLPGKSVSQIHAKASRLGIAGAKA